MITVIYGVIGVFLAVSIVVCIRRFVPDHGLPKEVTIPAIAFFFISSAIVQTEDIVTTTLLLIFVSYLSASAYTDYYSRYVYSLFSIVVGIAGYLYVVLNMSWNDIKQMLIFSLVVFLAYLFRAYASGDVEVFCVSIPFVYMLARRMELPVLGLLLFFFILSICLTLLWALVRLAIKRKKEKQIAMVPAIHGAASVLLILEMMIK